MPFVRVGELSLGRDELSFACYTSHRPGAEVDTAAAPARMAAMTSALSRSRPPAITGTCVRALISAMTRGMMPGRISTKSGLPCSSWPDRLVSERESRMNARWTVSRPPVTRPADECRAGGNDAVRVAQGIERVHRDLP